MKSSRDGDSSPSAMASPKPHHQIQIHLPHHQRNGNKEDDDNDVEATSAFHGVNPFSADENSNTYDSNAVVDGDEDLDDVHRSRIGGVRLVKRRNQDELSDGGTSNGGENTAYGSFKRPRTSSSSAGEYRKDKEEWSDAANRGNLRGRDLEEVSSSVSKRCEKLIKSVEKCKNKIDNHKKRYKLERHRMSSSGGTSASHWPWFKKMEEILGNSWPKKVPPMTIEAEAQWGML